MHSKLFASAAIVSASLVAAAMTPRPVLAAPKGWDKVETSVEPTAAAKPAGWAVGGKVQVRSVAGHVVGTGTITKLTKTQVTIEDGTSKGSRFMAATGRVYGGTTFYIVPAPDA